jgi:hypothetical protein
MNLGQSAEKRFGPLTAECGYYRSEAGNQLGHLCEYERQGNGRYAIYVNMIAASWPPGTSSRRG